MPQARGGLVTGWGWMDGWMEELRGTVSAPGSRSKEWVAEGMAGKEEQRQSPVLTARCSPAPISAGSAGFASSRGS